MTTACCQVPDGFDDALSHRHHLIPATHRDILLATVEEELVAGLESLCAIGAQHNVGFMERLDNDTGHAFHAGQCAIG